MKPNVRLTGILILSISIYYLIEHPTYSLIAWFTTFGGLWILLGDFMSFDNLNKRKTNWIRRGLAMTENTLGQVIVCLGSRCGPTNSKVFKNRWEKLPKSTSKLARFGAFLGRWTVYYDADSRTELWREAKMYGGRWYYIVYKREQSRRRPQ